MAFMWFLIACLSETCLAPQQMPDRDICIKVGAELKRTMIAGGARRVICFRPDTGESVKVGEKGE